MATVEQITTAVQLLQANLQHCELVGGELMMMSPAGFNHGGIAGNIGLALAAFVKPRRLGVVATAEPGFQIAHDPDTVRAPDVAFVRAERIPPGGVKGYFQGPPDIAVEVVSPNDRASDVMAKAAGLAASRLPAGLGDRSRDSDDFRLPQPQRNHRVK